MNVRTVSKLTTHRERPELEITFSSRDGYVWASWPGSSGSVRLGSQQAVMAMMNDFLTQVAIGQRMQGPECDRRSLFGGAGRKRRDEC